MFKYIDSLIFIKYFFNVQVHVIILLPEVLSEYCKYVHLYIFCIRFFFKFLLLIYNLIIINSRKY